VVGVENAVSFIGQGEPVKKQTPPNMPHYRFRLNYQVGSGWEVSPDYWSYKYQWLPANVGFREDGSAKFTSYVNNLHPTRFPDIYRTLERAIDKAIPAWDQCLREARRYRDNNIAGRDKSRFEWIRDAE
jgi:hypothetical protein